MGRSSRETLLHISRWCLYIGILVVPILFLPISLEVLELNKQTALTLSVLLAAILWLAWMVQTKTFFFRHGWLNLFPVLILAVFAISAFFSQGPYRSWIGSGGQLHTSVLSMAAFTLLFYLVANQLVHQQQQRIVHVALLTSAAAAGLIGVLSLTGTPLPFGFAQEGVFNTIGTVNGFGVFMAIMTAFACGIWVSYRNDRALLFEGVWGVYERLMIFFVAALGVTTLVLIDYWVSWVVLLAGLGVLFGFAFLRMKDFSHPKHFVLPAILFAVGLLMVFWVPSPFEKQVPAEVSPSFEASWEVARATIERGDPLLGSGPGTFLYDYARYRDLGINETGFWNTRFDRSASFLLTQLATIGVFGVFFWTLFFLATAGQAIGTILKKEAKGGWLLTYTSMIPWTAAVVALAIYSANMTHIFLLFLFAGLIASQSMPESYVRSFDDAPRAGVTFSFTTILVGFAIVTLIFISSQRYLAEAAFAKAVRLDREGAATQEIIASLDKATKFNRFNDVYYRNLSQAYLAKIKEEVDLLKRLDRISPERRKYIQALTAASIDAAKRATELAPMDVANWRTRGRVYRQLIPLIGNAAQFSIEAFEKAVSLEPSNPLNHLELGKTYLALAEDKQQMTVSPDASVRGVAEQTVEDALKKAEGSFTKAIELKPDYDPAHYQIGRVFERQGRIDDAIGKMERVAEHNQLDIGAKFQLGVLYLRRGTTGDVNLAREQFEEVIEIAPAYSNARWYLASVYEQQGNIDAAIAQVRKVLSLNPENTLVERRLERLRDGQVSEEVPEALEASGQEAPPKESEVTPGE